MPRWLTGTKEKSSLVEAMVKVLMGGNGKVFLGGSNGESPHGRQGKSSPENIRPGGLSFPGSIMEVLLGGGKGKVLQKISDRVV